MSFLTTNRRTIFVIAGVLLLVMLCVFVWLQHSQNGRYEILPVDPDRDLFPIRGADISAHNGIVDFEAVRADSIDFVILKATAGGTFKDRMFVNNFRRARRAGLKVGVYHFFRFDTPGYLQALNLLHSIDGHKPDMPLVIDLEESTNPKYVSTDTVMARLSTMVETLRQRGHRVMVYTNKQGMTRFFPEGTADDIGLWICSFSDPPLATRLRWHLWQYTHRGKIDGVDGAVDINTFNGSREDFALWLEEK